MNNDGMDNQNNLDNNQNNNPYNGGYNGQNPKGPKKSWKKTVTGVVVAASVVAVLGSGVYGVSTVMDQFKESNKMNISSQAPDATMDVPSEGILGTTEGAEATTDSVALVVENVMPSIVSITTTTTETVSDFFGRTYSEDVQGSGSGIIIGQNTNEVLIVTNNHVVSGANATVELTFFDEATVTGTIKGSDSSADLAVVAVKFADITDETKSKIKVISLGDSDKTKVGEMAIAIGNALGYGQAVTVGHVSALEREIAVEDSSMTLMQTDAAINPGNSGGALLNAQGQLIGINSAKTATTEVEGMGYAIPITDALPIIQDLMEGNIASDNNTAYLGIVGQNITSSNSKRFNIPEGVYVTEVAAGSPAEQAGLKAGMVIVGLDGKEIATSDDLMSVLDTLSVGDKVTINVAVNQGGKYVTTELNVTIGAKSDYESDSNANSGNDGSAEQTNPYGNDSYGSDPYSGSGGNDPFSFFGN